MLDPLQCDRRAWALIFQIVPPITWQPPTIFIKTWHCEFPVLIEMLRALELVVSLQITMQAERRFLFTKRAKMKR